MRSRSASCASTGRPTSERSPAGTSARRDGRDRADPGPDHPARPASRSAQGPRLQGRHAQLPRDRAGHPRSGADPGVHKGSRVAQHELHHRPRSSFPDKAGIGSALVGTLWVIGVCIAFIVPVGVASAVYLEEYADRNRWYNRFIEVNIQNLAAVPSIVYGILGLAFLVRGPLSLGRVVLAARPHPRPAGPAGGGDRRARGDPRRATLDPRGLDGSRARPSGRRSGSRSCPRPYRGSRPG